MPITEKSFFDITDYNYNGLIYLASPYTHNIPEVEDARYGLAVRAVMEFVMVGCCVISPIVHCHPVRKRHNLPGDAKFWKAYCYTLLKKCDAMRVLCIPGWFSSDGISQEIVQANKYKIPIEEVRLHQSVFEQFALAWN